MEILGNWGGRNIFLPKHSTEQFRTNTIALLASSSVHIYSLIGLV